MVNTRSMNTNNSKIVGMTDGDPVFDCNVVIRIHRDAIMEIDGKTHVIPSVNNDFNVQLRLVSDEYEMSDHLVVDDNVRDQESSKSCNIQVYKPATKMILKNVDKAWIRCKNIHKKSKQNIKKRDVVMAKLRGHPAWPAIILKLLPENRAKVEFFGAEPHEKFGFVNLSEVILFKDSLDILLLQLKKKIRKYEKAIKEAERVCGILDSNSVLNQ